MRRRLPYCAATLALACCCFAAVFSTCEDIIDTTRAISSVDIFLRVDRFDGGVGPSAQSSPSLPPPTSSVSSSTTATAVVPSLTSRSRVCGSVPPPSVSSMSTPSSSRVTTLILTSDPKRCLITSWICSMAFLLMELSPSELSTSSKGSPVSSTSSASAVGEAFSIGQPSSSRRRSSTTSVTSMPRSRTRRRTCPSCWPDISIFFAEALFGEGWRTSWRASHHGPSSQARITPYTRPLTASIEPSNPSGMKSAGRYTHGPGLTLTFRVRELYSIRTRYTPAASV
mmetsp:Transcript_1882/g.4728  ORF Transcript_1882/g.4728 Transcript_1882/m.4728 type:complete len:284 (-) Transcript_1882:697-1548(-)